MAKEKDPAFLFYTKDWLQGTAQLMPEEKGVFIDLLSHQHQDGDLPNDTKRLARIVGLPEKEFLSIWENLKCKFTEADINRLVNRKLTKVVTERATKSTTNKIAGIFASIIKQSKAQYEFKEQIKKQFKTDEFLTVAESSLTERLTIWYGERLKTIENGNANGNNVFKGGYGGNQEKSIKAVKLDKEKNVAVFADGYEQPLGADQIFAFEQGSLTANSVIKGHSY